MRRTRLIRRTSRRTWRVRVLISFLLFVEESYPTACSASVQQSKLITCPTNNQKDVEYKEIIEKHLA